MYILEFRKQTYPPMSRDELTEIIGGSKAIFAWDSTKFGVFITLKSGELAYARKEDVR